MKNIIWKQEDGRVAVTFINNDLDIDSQGHADELIARGDVPAAWAVVAVDYALPTDWLNKEWLWDGAAMVVDAAHLAENQAAEARYERDALLKDSDWTQFADAPIDDSKKAEWKSYRQASA